MALISRGNEQTLPVSRGNKFSLKVDISEKLSVKTGKKSKLERSSWSHWINDDNNLDNDIGLLLYEYYSYNNSRKSVTWSAVPYARLLVS